MFTITEKYILRKFLSHRIDKLRLKLTTKTKAKEYNSALKAREIDSALLEIRESVAILKEIDSQKNKVDDEGSI